MAIEAVEIGSYYTDGLCGIAFIQHGRGAFLLYLGPSFQTYAVAADQYAVTAPDGSYACRAWAQDGVHVQAEWARVGNAVLGRITADAPVTLALRAAPVWSSFTTTYRGAPGAITGNSRLADVPDAAPITWRVEAAGTSAPATDEHALAYTVDPAHPVAFAAGFDALPEINRGDARIAEAAAAYQRKRIQASGAWGDFVKPIANLLHNNRVYNPESGRIAHTVTRNWVLPDGQDLFEWDSFFNAILAAVEDPASGHETIRALLDTQQPNGLVPNFTRRGQGSTTDRSQPPVGAMCVWKLHQRWPDQAFLAEVYPMLAAWHAWWFAPRPENGLPNRDGNQNGLLEWGSELGTLQGAMYECGLDDSPMYEDLPMNPPSRTMQLDDVGLNALWAADAEYLALIAEALGKPDEAEAFRAQREAMAQRINELLWNDDAGMYCNRYWTNDGTSRFSLRWSPTNFFPLLAGIPDAARAARMLAVMTDPTKFWGEFVLPSIARDDPAFAQQNYWRGTIWAPLNYLVYQGLKRYAPAELRAEFARKSVALFMRNWTAHSTCREAYFASGDGTSDPHYTWGALLCLIGVEELCDIQPDGTLRLNGSLAEDISLINLPMFGKPYDWRVTPGHARLSRGEQVVLTAEALSVTHASISIGE